ncbi:MAG: hypothetical protein ACNI28_04340 [Arcobacter sp.]
MKNISYSQNDEKLTLHQKSVKIHDNLWIVYWSTLLLTACALFVKDFINV